MNVYSLFIFMTSQYKENNGCKSTKKLSLSRYAIKFFTR
jgi:hypothetical protein